MKKSVFTALSFFALPLVAFAQQPTDVTSLIRLVGYWLNLLVPVLMAAALVVFFWGLVQYIFKKKGAKDIMTAGLLGLFVMASVWGIIRLAQNTLGVNNNATVNPPYVPLR